MYFWLLFDFTVGLEVIPRWSDDLYWLMSEKNAMSIEELKNTTRANSFIIVFLKV